MREPACKTNGFTLIEIMIVTGIAALVMATAVPFAWHMLRKDPLRQAVSDVVEACSHARARAIFSGLPAELRILPPQRSLQVTAGTRSGDEQQNPTDPDAAEARQVVPAQSANFSAKLGEGLVIEELAVNFLPFKDAEEAKAYLNGNLQMMKSSPEE